jgi:hypothetical protein
MPNPPVCFQVAAAGTPEARTFDGHDFASRGSFPPPKAGAAPSVVPWFHLEDLRGACQRVTGAGGEPVVEIRHEHISRHRRIVRHLRIVRGPDGLTMGRVRA